MMSVKRENKDDNQFTSMLHELKNEFYFKEYGRKSFLPSRVEHPI